MELRLSAVVLVMISALAIVGANAQFMSEWDIDVTPHLDRLERLYNRLQRGAHNLMHWPVVRRKPHAPPPPPATPTISLHPQTVLFSKTQSSSAEAAGGEQQGPKSEGSVPVEEVENHEASGSEIHSQVLPMPRPHNNGKNYHGPVNYVDNTFHTAQFSANNNGPQQGLGAYDLYADKHNRFSIKPPRSLAVGGGSFSGSKWNNEPPPHRRQRPSHIKSFSGGNRHHNGLSSNHNRRPHYSYSSGPPPPSTFFSRPQQSHSVVTHSSSSGGGGSGHEWSQSPASYQSPVSMSDFSESNSVDWNSNFGGYHQSPVEAPYGSSVGVNVNGLGGGGKSWGPKVCDPLSEVPFQVTSLDTLPPNAIITDGFGRPARLSDLAPSLVPQPPINFNIGVSAGLPLPPGYTLYRTEQYDITLNPYDGSTTFNKEVQNGMNSNMFPVGRQQSLNSIRISNYIAISPKFSAPIGGTASEFFTTGLQNRNQAFPDGARHPINTQVETLLQVFNEIEGMERESEAREGGKSAMGQGVWGSGGYSSGGGGSLAAPLLVTMIQRFSIPEPNSSEPAILDSAYNFGPQANRISFGDLELVTEAWKKDRAVTAPTVDISSLGNSVEEVQEALNDRIRGFVRSLRRATAVSFNPLEDLAYNNLFQQEQYFIGIPGECTKPVDPPHATAPTGGLCSIGRIKSTAPISCIPPAC